MNLFQKFMAVLKAEINHYGMTNFGSLADQDIIAIYFNLKTKIIYQFPYMIKESREVIAKLSSLGTQYDVAYEEIKLRLKNGDDVNPFLSKEALNPEFHDYLLLDWNIHHLHLNNNNSGNYFNCRSSYLLMLLFNYNIAHFIDIEHHNDPEVFVKREYLKIIKDNWPEVIESYELKGVLDVSFNPTNAEIKKFRKNQINTILKIENKVYSPPGGGINLAGSGQRHIQKAMELKEYIDSVDAKYQTNIDIVLDFAYDNNHLVLIDKNSNSIIEVMIA